MEIPKSRFEIVRKNKIMMSHPLKEYLRVGCVTTWNANNLFGCVKLRFEGTWPWIWKQSKSIRKFDACYCKNPNSYEEGSHTCRI
jgi:hypothetical protein